MRRGLILAAVVLTLGSAGDGPVVGPVHAGDAPPVAQPAPVAPKADLPRQTIDLGNGVTFEMVQIPPGEFDMGSPKEEPGRLGDEALHRVRITKPFWLGRTEVTQAAWAVVMGRNPSGFKDPTFPVTDVSWDDGQAFAKRLNETVPGGGFRLPTEAEWEYACRAGSRTTFCCGEQEKTLADHAWYEANSGRQLHPVGRRTANGWGLHDMHGNVWEWCQDWHRGYDVVGQGVAVDPVVSDPASEGRAQRGGCWLDPAARVRSACRSFNVPSFRYVVIGLGLARTAVADVPPPHAPGNAPSAPPAAPRPPGEPAPPVAPKPGGRPAVLLEIGLDGGCVLDGQSLGRITGAPSDEVGRTEAALRARLKALTSDPGLREPGGASRVRLDVRADRSTKWRVVQRVMEICSDPAIRIFKIHVSATKRPSEPTPTAPGVATPVPPSAGDGDIPSWAKVASEQIEAARVAGVPVAFENSIGMRFVLIPAGTFTMGYPVAEEGTCDAASHEVTLTKPYYLGVTEVTNGQYRRFMADHGSGAWDGLSLDDDDHPVVNVSWDDAAAFVAWLSVADPGRAYRLPTEAEWERACRAGSRGRWHWGDDARAVARHANVPDSTAKARWPRWAVVDADDGEAVTAPVGRYAPNAYGLYDTLGNVWEWCSDAYAAYPAGRATDPAGPVLGGSDRVLRGGSWFFRPAGVGAGDRLWSTPKSRFIDRGFRVAVPVGAKPPAR